jgi:hypothetical protein
VNNRSRQTNDWPWDTFSGGLFALEYANPPHQLGLTLNSADASDSRHSGFPHHGELTMRSTPLPPWIDRARPLVGIVLGVTPIYLLAIAYYGGAPATIEIGYTPQQPVPFSHALHAGDLGIDCRYCHTTVESAAHAALPATTICMNCHQRIAPTSEKLLLVRQSYATGQPIPWVKVHDLPDFVYFNHSAHVSRGVSCVWCHGRVDKMQEISQVEKLSMGWCLDCHRNPEPRLWPKRHVTDLDWDMTQDKQDLAVQAVRLRRDNNINPSTDCSTCHR